MTIFYWRDKIYLVAAKEFVTTKRHNTYAVVAELADAHGSGPCGLTPVEVRVLSTASYKKTFWTSSPKRLFSCEYIFTSAFSNNEVNDKGCNKKEEEGA